jgi:prophage regulatory protein
MDSSVQTSAIRGEDISRALLLRIGTVVKVTGLGRSTICRLIAKADFPSRVRLTNQVVAWRRSDLEKWNEARLLTSH